MTFKLTRRTALGLGAAALALPRSALASPGLLRAEPVNLQLLPDDGPATPMLGFNGSSPGPELRVTQGDEVRVVFENNIGAPSALHWHGIRIANAMDGVPEITQDAVPDGGRFEYAFTVPDAGTYWYHSHSRSFEQVERGLYGALIVEEHSPPTVDQDVTVIIDDWRLTEDGTLAEGFGNRHDFAHAGRLGNWDVARPSVGTARLGDRVRLRLINSATARVFPLRISGIDGYVVALDGMPLDTPRALQDFELAPAQRVDIIADVRGAVGFEFLTPDDSFEFGRIVLEGANPTPVTSPITALPPAAVNAPGTPSQSLTLTMRGGAMGGAHGGDDIWSFNDISGLQEVPFARFDRGETALIRLINDTSWPHAMHLHGHHFHEVSEDGALGDLRDTTLLARGEARDILCVFDNPGKWLLHCHMLGHQAAGMKTWVDVT